MAARMKMGDEIVDSKRTVSLKQLSKNSLKRNDKKSGRKKPRCNDYDRDVIAAPDSVTLNQDNDTIMVDSTPPKTPKSTKKLGPSKTPIQQIKTPTNQSIKKETLSPVKKETTCSKKKLRFQLEDSDTCNISEDNVQLVKKRKVADNTESLQNPWVNNLNESHKLKISNKEWICSDIINEVQSIMSKQFPGLNGFQLTNLAPVYDSNKCKWKNQIAFQSVVSPSVQIHHNGRDHWVTSFQTSNGDISVLDSLASKENHTVNTPSIELQLCSIYGNNKSSIPVKILDVQDQNNGYDCGLFAIANMVEFCFKGNSFKQKTNFIENQMRDHLIWCLDKGYFMPFPQFVKIASQLKKASNNSITINCSCSCGFPDWMDEMIGCDWRTGRIHCKTWKHKECANLTESEEQ
ncbi:hypothetical protein CI610_03284 [invertebrate metagenome]|uniref:Ubiquitin-like protease family profile domain-containing protein n=1 Tax=invertebrate metagenome TaxID=1711999 RepID=A0A2H9T3L9_9ZZZZ